MQQCTEVRFASFLSGGFITAIVVNPPERKLAKSTSVQWSMSYYGCHALNMLLKTWAQSWCQVCLWTMSDMVKYRAVSFKKEHIAALYFTMSDIVHYSLSVLFSYTQLSRWGLKLQISPPNEGPARWVIAPSSKNAISANKRRWVMAFTRNVSGLAQNSQKSCEIWAKSAGAFHWKILYQSLIFAFILAFLATIFGLYLQGTCPA